MAVKEPRTVPSNSPSNISLPVTIACFKISEKFEINVSIRAVYPLKVEVLERDGIPLQIPKARIELPVLQILRLLHLGFRLGKVDSRFEIRINSGQRVPMLNGNPMPEDQWQEPMPCVLKHEALSVLYQSGQKALVYLENNPPDDKKHKILKQQFRKKLEPVFYGTVPPSPSRLRQPPSVPMGLSLFDQPEFPGDSMLTETSKQVVKLQEASQAPSLFKPEQSDLLRDFESTLVLLLDISASTSEQSLFKVSQIACSSLMTLLRRKLKKTQIFVIPYNDPVSYTHLTLPTSDLV